MLAHSVFTRMPDHRFAGACENDTLETAPDPGGPRAEPDAASSPSPHHRMNVILQHLGLVMAGVLVAITAASPFTATANEALTVSVTRPDLRPLPGVTLQLAGAVDLQRVTDNTGRATLLGMPPAGVVTVTPSRSGFRFEPPQFTIPDAANPPVATFTAFPTATDLALSLASDDTTPPRLHIKINPSPTLRIIPSYSSLSKLCPPMWV